MVLVDMPHFTPHVRQEAERRHKPASTTSNGVSCGSVVGFRLGLVLNILVMVCSPQSAPAFSARLGWTSVPGAAGYKIYVRQDSGSYSFGTDVGLVAADPDGVIRSTVSGLAFNVINYFAVTSYSPSRVESSLSNELSLMVSGTSTPTVGTTPSMPPAQGIPPPTPTQAGTITLSTSSPLGPYLCYRAWRTARSAPFVQQTLSLQDQFESMSALVLMPIDLCAPVNEGGPGIVDPATHEEAYKIRPAARSVPQRGLQMIDELGTLVVNTSRPDRLLIPTSKGLGIVPPPPLPGADQFKCYSVLPSATTGFQRGVQVALVDQLERRLYDVKRPTHLCTPVDDNGRGVSDPLARLMCYKIMLARGQLRQAMVLGQIRTFNQFGPGSLDTGGEDELCVPATQAP